LATAETHDARADRIAEILHSRDIKGYRRRADWCPLSNNLAKELVPAFDRWIFIRSCKDYCAISWLSGDEEHAVRYPLSDGEREFIQKFDRGDYAHLSLPDIHQ
jgi:hypothetical protein